MATVQGTLDQPLEDAAVATRRAAGSQGYSIREGESAPNVLVFKKESTRFSWGSQLTVVLSSISPTQTRLTITTKEKWALAEWGRGRHAARRLLDEMGAQH